MLVAGVVIAWESTPSALWSGVPQEIEVEAAVTDAESGTSSFEAGRAGFQLRVRDDLIPYHVFGVFVMPNEALHIEPVFTAGRGRVTISAQHGTTEQLGSEHWRWTAPTRKGLYPVEVTDQVSGDTITLNMFVRQPYRHAGASLNGYRIGTYRAKPLRGLDAYERPGGFVEVTPDLMDAKVSPHFTIQQFLCKQQPGRKVKYVEVKERLVLKLEMILEQVNELGTPANTLHVMSGFRTPWYNRSIGNRTSYSQHLYGGAADIFVDANHNNTMDDLNGDGRITKADATVLANIIETQKNEVWYQPFVGGLGVYGPASHRGPFVHIDVRGTFARW